MIESAQWGRFSGNCLVVRAMTQVAVNTFKTPTWDFIPQLQLAAAAVLVNKLSQPNFLHPVLDKSAVSASKVIPVPALTECKETMADAMI